MHAQTWAGPDTIACGYKGVIIGSTEPCPNCCFSWTPTEGLSDPKIKNPRARPRKKTTYTVVVTDANLSWKKTDDVVVDLTFGEMRFVPKFLEQGTDDIALVRLINNVGNYNTAWSIQGEDLGCIITPSGDINLASVMAGDEYGKLLIKVTRTEDTECYFIDTLPVNNGVKDVIAIDKNTPNRFAKTGQTLFLVGDSAHQVRATIVAIPNEGGFKEGVPDWKPDSFGSQMLLDGDETQDMQEEPLPIPIWGNPSDYIAGEDPEYQPKVTVRRMKATEDPAPVMTLVTKLNEWWQDLEESCNFDDLFVEPGEPESPCPEIEPFVAEGTFDASVKDTEVEKYASPELGVRTVIGIDAGVNVTGRIYHPGLTQYRVIFGFGICSEAYASMTYNNTLHLGITKDESLEDLSWKLNDPQIEMSITGEVAFKAVLLGGGTGYSLEASGSASTGVTGVIDYKIETKQFVASAKVKPVTLKVEAILQNENNLGEYEPLFKLPSQEFVLYKGFASDPLVLYTIPN